VSLERKSLVMLSMKMGQNFPELRELVAEASCALARLDTARLEELALSCEALNCGLTSMSAEEKARLSRQAGEAAGDMAVFARVLDATRANLNVMKKLRELRVDRLEYSERRECGPASAEGGNGDH
jgi:hypothetical protein